MKHINLQSWVKRPSTFTILLTLSLLIITFTVGCIAAQQEVSLTPPPNFQPLAEVDLSAQPFEGAILGQFTLEETAVTTIFYTIPNIDTAYFDLSLSGPDGSSYLILHSEDYQTDKHGGGEWEQNLPPGEYRVMLTAQQSPGVLSVYWGYR
jgi:hypothetical protein